MEGDRDQDAVEPDVPARRWIRHLQGQRRVLHGEAGWRSFGPTSLFTAGLDNGRRVLLLRHHNRVHVERGHREYHSASNSSDVRRDGDPPLVPDGTGRLDVLLLVPPTGGNTAERDHHHCRAHPNQVADGWRLHAFDLQFTDASHLLPNMGCLRMGNSRVPRLGAGRYDKRHKWTVLMDRPEQIVGQSD